jgi:hypothetical protein
VQKEQKGSCSSRKGRVFAFNRRPGLDCGWAGWCAWLGGGAAGENLAIFQPIDAIGQGQQVRRGVN